MERLDLTLLGLTSLTIMATVCQNSVKWTLETALQLFALCVAKAYPVPTLALLN